MCKHNSSSVEMENESRKQEQQKQVNSATVIARFTDATKSHVWVRVTMYTSFKLLKMPSRIATFSNIIHHYVTVYFNIL